LFMMVVLRKILMLNQYLDIMIAHLTLNELPNSCRATALHIQDFSEFEESTINRHETFMREMNDRGKLKAKHRKQRKHGS
jgi:hypothetical protein